MTRKKDSPIIVNQTKYTIVVFQERGVFFNRQVLHPNEALGVAREASSLLPYYIHALVGDESCLPSVRKSIQNLALVSAIPAVFIAGVLATSLSAGTLAGPAAALAPLVSGMVVNGVVIDAAAISAGAILASKASVISEWVVKKYPEKFMAKSKFFLPGTRYVAVKGGIDDGPIEFSELSKRDFKKLQIDIVRVPRDSSKTTENKEIAKDGQL
mmetsp:Transcript_11858/g.17112  ORF Transcript_11858/g.17112 Transcript_11858/m.17112 type:complete len:213 (-) Transcript_11858:1901-2539(-)